MIDLAAERPENPDLLFVGGTGRSGTHVVSQLLASHSHWTRVPIEARFHVNPQGFPDLLAGQVSPEQFLRKLKRFWWRRIRAGEVAPVVARRLAFGRKVRGLHKIVERDRFDAAVAEFETTVPDDPDRACRNLFLDLLWPLGRRGGQAGPDRDELLHDRREPDAGPALPRREADPHRPRRARRRLLEGLEAAEAQPPARRRRRGSAGGRAGCARSRQGSAGCRPGAC